MAKKIDELERPKIPGYIDMSKVNSAAGNIAAARDAINNLNYDTFKQGTQYGNLKKSYEQQGQAAMKDTLGQVAARTGGMASSYATSAANQSYNNYMQTLEDAARSMFNEEYARKKDAYNMAQQEYNNEWNRYQNEYSQAWDKYNAENSNFQSDRTYNYQLKRDQKSDNDAATEQAQDDILAIWEAGGTPSVELLQAAGWYDATAPDGLSVTGAAYKSEIDEGITNKNTTDAQKVVADLWAVGGTPSSEQLIAAGYQDANGNWTDAGLAEMVKATGLKDGDLEKLLSRDDFNWDTYWKTIDTDKDGVFGEQEDMDLFFAASNLGGTEYWYDWYESQGEKTTTDAQGRVSDAWAAGDDPNEQDLIDAGYVEVGADGKAIIENGDYKYTTAGKDALANSSALGKMDMEYLLTSGGWKWGDWDRDGTVEDDEDVTAKQFFSKSGGSEEAWKAWLDDYNEGQQADDIEARIANGDSLEDIAAAYKIDVNSDEEWKDITGMTKAQWQKFANDNKVGNYHFADTSAGRAGIVDKMLGSGSLKLGSGDQANFDYLYGDGAYDAVQTFIETISPNNMGSERFGDSDFHQYTLNAFENEFNRIVNELYEIAPGLDYTTQVLEIVKKANPEMYEAATNLSKYKFAD